MTGEREHSVSRSAPSSVYLHPFKRNRTGAFQRFNHSEAIEDPDRLRAHVFGAWLISGESGPIDSQHRESGSGKESCCGAAGRSGSCHDYVHLR
jgi:hypothetical protein